MVTRNESAFHSASQRFEIAESPICVRQQDVILCPFIPGSYIDHLRIRVRRDEVARGTHQTLKLVGGAIDCYRGRLFETRTIVPAHSAAGKELRLQVTPFRLPRRDGLNRSRPIWNA